MTSYTVTVPLHCKRAMTLTDSPVGEVWMCERCGHGQVVVPAEIPRKPAPKTILDRVNDLNEKTVARSIINALKEDGYIVVEICQRGGIRSGTSVGAPDLLIMGKDVPLGSAVLLEPKVAIGWKWSSEQQMKWCQAGRINKVHSVEDARQAVRESLARCRVQAGLNESDYKTAQLSAVEKLIERCKPRDFLSKMSLESRRDELKREIDAEHQGRSGLVVEIEGGG